MEQPCYKCGQVLEEGRPFCPHCAAPQIRVLVAEPVAATAPLSDDSTPDRAIPGLPASQTIPVLAVSTRWSQAVKPCALAALVASLLMTLRLNPFVAMFGAGFLAVVFFRQGRPGMAVKTANGIRLGALSGLLCFGMMALLVTLAAMVPDVRVKIREQIQEQVTLSAQNLEKSHPGDPQIQAALEQLKTPEGFVMMLISGCVLLLVISIVLGGFGGALGGAIFSRRDRP